MPAPAQPAPVSGPGSLSRRTDGGPAQKLSRLPDAKYGEQATYQADQRGAALSQTPTPQIPAPNPLENPAAANVVPFDAPTQRPNEPVTSGASMGAGPGIEALGIQPQQIIAKDAQRINQYLPILEAAANQGDALPGSRMFVNLVKSQPNPGDVPTHGPAAPAFSGGPQIRTQ